MQSYTARSDNCQHVYEQLLNFAWCYNLHKYQFLFWSHIYLLPFFTFTLGQKSKTNSDSLHSNNPVNVKNWWACYFKKNELSAEVRQLFLIKSCKGNGKYLTKQWRWAEISMDGLIRTEADLHNLEEVCYGRWSWSYTFRLIYIPGHENYKWKEWHFA